MAGVDRYLLKGVVRLDELRETINSVTVDET